MKLLFQNKLVPLLARSNVHNDISCNRKLMDYTQCNLITSRIIIPLIFLPFFILGQNTASSLEQYFEQLEHNFDVNISYNVELLRTTTINTAIPVEGLSLKSSLLKLLRNTAWEFEILADKYVVIKEASPTFYAAYRKSICGIVKEYSSREALPFANVKLLYSTEGVSTQADGAFEFHPALVRNDSLEISYLGYKSVVIPVSYFEKTPCSVVRLKPESNELKAVVVKENRSEALFLANEEGTGQYFSLQKLALLGGQVERDIFQMIQLLPGVTAQGESSSSFHIRGGTKGQNLVLYDGITLYHFGHFFGKVSAVNPAFSDKVTLLTEGIDARYGGRVAGVIDIKSRAEIPEKTKWEADINSLSGNFTMHTPLFKQKGHLLIAYRGSYSDRIKSGYFKKIFDQVFQNSRIAQDQNYTREDSINKISSLLPITSFSDFNVKVAWKAGRNNEMSFSYIDIRDDLYYNYKESSWYESVDTLSIYNSGFNFSLKHTWHEQSRLLLEVSRSYLNSRYLFFANLADSIIATKYNTRNTIDDYTVKLSNEWEADDQSLRAGIQYNVIKENYEVSLIAPWQSPDYRWASTARGKTFASFVDYKYEFSKKVHFDLGIRASYYNLTNKFYIEPRFHIRIYPSADWTLKISSGVYYQTINEIIEYNELNADAGMWVLSRTSDAEGQVFFSVVQNNQYSLGLERTFNDWKLTVGAYQKSLLGITSRSLQIGDEFPWLNGTMSAQGLEFSLQKQNDYFFSLLSYTLSGTYYDFDYVDYLIAAAYDQRHNISWLQGFYWNKFTFSSTVKWHTGTPFAKGPQRKDNRNETPDDPAYWIEFEQFNGLRLPDYLRWDLSLSWAFGKKRLKGKLNFAALNILNKRNLLSRNYALSYSAEEDSPPAIIEMNRYGLSFTPNLGCLISF